MDFEIYVEDDYSKIPHGGLHFWLNFKDLLVLVNYGVKTLRPWKNKILKDHACWPAMVLYPKSRMKNMNVDIYSKDKKIRNKRYYINCRLLPLFNIINNGVIII